MGVENFFIGLFCHTPKTTNGEKVSIGQGCQVKKNFLHGQILKKYLILNKFKLLLYTHN